MTDNFFTSLAQREAQPVTEDIAKVRAWFSLLGGFTDIERHLRRVMAGSGLNLPRFDILLLLSHHAEGLNMSELAKQLVVSNGNVTGVVRHLESDGFVVRVADQGDRRIQTVRLTDKGRLEFKANYEKYVATIVGAFKQLSSEDIEFLARIMLKVASGGRLGEDCHDRR